MNEMTTAEQSNPDAVSQPRRRSRLRALLLKLTAMAIAFALALLIAEVAVRIVLPQHPSWLDVFASSDSPPYTLQPNLSRTISTGESTWSVHTDANGFRVGAPPSPAGQSAAPPRAAASTSTTNQPNLLILGDSFPFGMGVNYQDSIPGHLEKALSHQYRILNTGVPGYGPTQYRQVLQRELARGAPIAGVVLITFLGNDFHDCIWKKTGNVRDGILGNERGLKSFIKRNSHLYRLTANVYHRVGTNQVEDRPHEWQLYDPQQWSTGPLKQASEIYQSEIGTIRDLCRANNLPLLACIIPPLLTVQGPQHIESRKPTAVFDLPETNAKTIFQSAGIPFVDATPELIKLGWHKTYFSWDQHLNPTGNKLVAQSIAAALTTVLPPNAITRPSHH